jgi:hypothetical protein
VCSITYVWLLCVCLDLQEGIRDGKLSRETLKPNAVMVDAIVSTIGFPLVGGPAGRKAIQMYTSEIRKSEGSCLWGVELSLHVLVPP